MCREYGAFLIALLTNFISEPVSNQCLSPSSNFRYIVELLHLQVKMYLMFGIILFLLADNGSCKDTFSSTAVSG